MTTLRARRQLPAGLLDQPVEPTALAVADLLAVRGAFVLGPVTLAVRPGRLTCVVGPNGSGKTTLLRLMLGLLRPESGAATLAGQDIAGRPRTLLRSVGYVPDEGDSAIPELTAPELWRLHALAHASVSGSLDALVGQAARLAEWLDFDPPARPVSSFSHGMVKKTQLVAGLLHDPSVVVMDEPRNGLDPIAIERLEQLVRHLVAGGRTVLVATHDLRFAERVADDLLVLHHGELVYSGPAQGVCRPGEDLVEAFFRLVDGVPSDD